MAKRRKNKARQHKKPITKKEVKMVQQPLIPKLKEITPKGSVNSGLKVLGNIKIENDHDEKLRTAEENVTIMQQYLDEHFHLTKVRNIRQCPVYECGLCSDRHTMPVQNFVFATEEVNRHMFDFEWQHQVAKRFIQNHIKFDKDGKPMQRLRVFTTGLNSLNGAMMSAANEERVSMDFMHFNNSTGTYQKQEVLKFESDVEDPTPFESLFVNRESENIYVEGNPKAEVTEQVYLLVLMIAGKDQETIQKWSIVLPPTRNIVWEKYGELVEFLHEEKIRASIFLDRILTATDFQHGYRYVYNRSTLTKGYTFKYYK